MNSNIVLKTATTVICMKLIGLPDTEIQNHKAELSSRFSFPSKDRPFFLL
jgi:hypothetical protein